MMRGGDHHPGRTADAFAVIPAIDLLGGRVVRLRRGEFGDATAFGDDPVATAREWEGQGAPRLHVVDLDGARDGTPRQEVTVGRIAAAVSIPCQVGGGLRDAAAVARILSAGAAQAVLATALLEVPALAGELVARHGPACVAAALDVRDGRVVGHGWDAGAPSWPLPTALARLRDGGIERFVVTAIARDGVLAGPDLTLYARVLRLAPAARVVASGGISSVDDLVSLRDLGCAGAILGRALYDGRLTLAEAADAVRA